MSNAKRDEAAEDWLRKNDWDFQKYGDRRPDRSAYDTRMNYEISDLLIWAFEAGYDSRNEEVEKLLGVHDLAGVIIDRLRAALREREFGEKK